MQFFDSREVGRYPSIAEAMAAVDVLRAEGVAATFQEDPAGSPEAGAPCPAAVLVKDPADRSMAAAVLGQQAAQAMTPGRRWRQWVEVGVVLLVAWAPAVFEGVAGYVWPAPEEDPGPVPFSLYPEHWLLSLYLPLIGLVLYLLWRDSRPARDFGLVRPRIVVDALGAVVLLLALDVTGRLAQNILLIFLPALPPAPSYAPPDTSYGYGVLSLATLVGATAEELVYRSYLLPHLRALLGRRWLAVVLAGALFGVAHLYQGVDGVVTSALFGILLGATFFLSGRVWPLILAHFLWNMSVFL